MMKKLDERGAVAFEFTLVAVPLFTLMFVFFDLARYVITAQSLHGLANAEARAFMICYAKQYTSNPQGSSSNCGGDLVSNKQTLWPFLYAGGFTPTANVPTPTTSPITITASSNFTMLMPIWGATLNNPSVTTSVPFVPF